MSRSSVSLTVQTMGSHADRLPDETLLAGLGAGDADLAVAFVRRFQRVVYGVALTVTRDPVTAEDVAQQAFMIALQIGEIFPIPSISELIEIENTLRSLRFGQSEKKADKITSDKTGPSRH